MLKLHAGDIRTLVHGMHPGTAGLKPESFGMLANALPMVYQLPKLQVQILLWPGKFFSLPSVV